MAKKTVKDIRITDPVLRKMVAEEQKRLGDSSATKTAGRIIERYFASRTSSPQQSQPAPT